MTRARDLASGFNGIRPFAMAAGGANIAPGGTTVTFPAGRFTQLPQITTGLYYETASGAAPAGFCYVGYAAITTTGMTLFSKSGTNLGWYMAVQMTSSAAAG
jgi:hypothetical protein